MCRYAFKTYKSHYVCFACRKQFKQTPLQDLLAQRGQLAAFKRLKPEARVAVHDKHRERPVTCPECGALMADLGLDFRPPRASATRAWKRLQALHTIGQAWQTCGCNGPGYIPIDQAGYTQYLRARLRSYRGQLAHAERPSTAKSPAERAKAARHWAKLAERVEAELVQSKKRGRRFVRA